MLEPFVQSDFSLGLVAVVGRYQQPPNSVFRLSNFFYRTPGDLEVVDGSLIVTTRVAPGPTNSIVIIAPFTPVGSAAKILALQFSGAQYDLIDVSGATYNASLATLASTYATPDLVMFAGKLVVVAGLSVVPQLWNGAALTPITNSWTAAGYIPLWQAALPVQVGDVIQPTPTNGFFYICEQAGLTGAALPAFPVVAGTVVDNNVIWRFTGPTTPVTVPKAAHAFNHLDSLWLWGTDAAEGPFDGPSSLRMSDTGNPNSYNPINQDFIGVGDGQTAQGGASMSMGELGIASTPTLVLFKDRSTYEIVGSFPVATASKAKTDKGCIAARSIQFIAELGGVIRLTHQGFALYTGPGQTGDQLLSEVIQDYIFPNSSDVAAIDFTNASVAKSGQMDNPLMYLCAVPIIGGSGNLTRVFIYSILQKVWAIADLPFNITALNFVQIPNVAAKLLLGDKTGGNVRRWMANDSDFDGAAISWSVRGPLMRDKRGAPVYFRRVTVQTSGGTPTITSATLDYDDIATARPKTQAVTTVAPYPVSPPVSLSLGITTRGAQITVNGKGKTKLEALEWHGVRKRPRQIAGV